MDLSSLPEAQQQQLQQLHQQFQEHQLQKQQEQQQQEQQHQQELASQSYYASQVQSYDQSSQGYDQSYQAYDQSNQGYESYDHQSTQGYYPYHHYPQHHQEQQQHYPYYHSDYANVYQPQTQTQPQSQPSQPDVQPPGISAPPETSSQALGAIPGQGQLQQQQEQHNAYYPQGVLESSQQNRSAYPVPSGLNPAAAAAVAALSQLNQFAGTMDAAERAMAGMHDRHWQPKNGGYGPMPPHMYLQEGYHYGPYPVREGGRGGGKPYRGGGRRGGGPSHGVRGNFGARHPRQDGSAPNLRGRGRGRGRGRRFPPHDGSSTPYPGDTPSEPVSASANEEAEQSAAEHGDAPETALVSSSATTPGQAPQSTVAQGKAASTRRPPQIAWCELCRVDCTSLEILEQHKNGKKHKKNLQRFEELQPGRSTLPIPIPMPVVTYMPTPKDAPAPVSTSAATAAPISTSAATAAPLSTSVSTAAPSPELTPITEPLPTSVPAPNLLVDGQNEQEPLAGGKSEVTKQHENGQGDEIINQTAPENLSTEADENIMEIENQTDIQQQPDISEAEPSEAMARKRRMDRFDARKRGANRKVRGGRGSKRMRMVERPSRQVEPPKEVAPIICELCNVKCDTRAVFDCHLAGKKHISKLKRFQGHQAIYGPVGIQALYPPNPNTHPAFIPHQQPMYMPQRSFRQMMAYGPPQSHHVATGSEPRFPQVNPGISQIALSSLPEGQQQAGPVPQEQAVLTKSGNSFSDYAGNTSHPPQDSVLQSTANTAAVFMNVQASPAVPIPEYGASSSENATLPGIQVQPEQSSV